MTRLSYEELEGEYEEACSRIDALEGQEVALRRLQPIDREGRPITQAVANGLMAEIDRLRDETASLQQECEHDPPCGRCISCTLASTRQKLEELESTVDSYESSEWFRQMEAKVDAAPLNARRMVALAEHPDAWFTMRSREDKSRLYVLVATGKKTDDLYRLADALGKS